MNDLDRQELALTAVRERLVQNGVLTPISLEGRDEYLWSACELSSFAENRLGEVVDPFTMTRDQYWRWSNDLLDGPIRLAHDRKHDSCYWIVADGEHVGSISLSKFCLGDFAFAYSVYVRPQHRGAGYMRATLQALLEELESHGLGLRLDTCWTWQRSVRFYLRAGFWLHSWKRDLGFIRRPNTPSPRLVMEGAEARLVVDRGGTPVVLAKATRSDDHLLEFEFGTALPGDLEYLSWDGATTLALHLALEGWPLRRAGPQWNECRHSDAVHPEALAECILFWEAYAAKRGWRVETPRIPGLM